MNHLHAVYLPVAVTVLIAAGLIWWAIYKGAQEDVVSEDEWERRIAQPIVLERYRELALRRRESKLDRDVREAIEAANR